MPGPVPGIHVFLWRGKSWMAGTSPAMTMASRRHPLRPALADLREARRDPGGVGGETDLLVLRPGRRLLEPRLRHQRARAGIGRAIRQHHRELRLRLRRGDEMAELPGLL